MRIEYFVNELREGGEDPFDLQSELDQLALGGWEFCEWVEPTWNYSSGPGPNTRRAIFKKITR